MLAVFTPPAPAMAVQKRVAQPVRGEPELTMAALAVRPLRARLVLVESAKCGRGLVGLPAAQLVSAAPAAPPICAAALAALPLILAVALLVLVER